ncbi:MAG: FAD-binding oxidoreductase [Salinisphaeraceae bacterium]
MTKTRNPIGWGYLEDRLEDKQRERILPAIQMFLGGELAEHRPPPDDADVAILRAKLTPPDSLREVIATDHASALLHAAGRSFRDLATLRAGNPVPAPDLVATPRDENELAEVLAWASDQSIAVIPFGGGSSVVGGVNPEALEDRNGVVSLDLQQLRQVIEVSERDRVVHAQAGILGPDLDAALKPHGLAVRHYPQSYFHSTLGGWVATRGAGHFSTLRAKIEDRVQALSVMLPDGRMVETRPLPASSIGPDPNRLWCGSEGALGVIVDARLRVVADPEHKLSRSVAFDDFPSALEATRAIVQADLWPSQMRVLDPYENLVSGALSGNPGQGALMILGFEGERDRSRDLDDALAIAQDHGGRPNPPADSSGSGAWRDTFFRQPYLRDALLDYALIMDTFETAVPWSALPTFYHEVRQATLDAVNEVGGTGGVTCRVTHAYPDGVCLYFSFYAPGRHDSLVQQWREIRDAGADAVNAGGGTQSHHHAMGRDHQRWAREEIPAAFRSAVRAARQELDPRGIMNPGLWFDT